VKTVMAACIVLFVAAGAFASGEWDYGRDRIIGSGNVRTEDRTVPAFRSIELEGSGNVTLSQGPVQSLSVETDDNVLGAVETEVVGGVLHLGFKRGTRIGRLTLLEFRVTAPRVDAVVISGSGDVRAATTLRATTLRLDIRGSGNIDASIDVDVLRAGVSGSGDITVDGSAREISVSIDGSGNVKARGLSSTSADVRINGSGDADVTATDAITVAINGSGDVLYGGGAKATVRASGSGTARER